MKQIYLIIVFCIFVLAGCFSSSEETKKIYIDGIEAVDIHGNLTDRGFSLDTNLSIKPYRWTCKNVNEERSLEVSVYGDGPTKITEIEAVVQNYSTKSLEEVGGEFLGFVATIPYKGAMPASAKVWVLQNINISAKTTFGKVTFEITANPNAPRSRFLVIRR